MREASSFELHSGEVKGGPAEKESPGLLYKIFHASPSPITISRFSDGTLTDVNEEWSRFTGYSVEEAIGQNSLDLDIWVEPKRYTELMEKLGETEAIHEEELDVRTRAGAIRTVIWSAQCITVGGEPCLLTVMSDITQHKASELALRESEQRFRMMADSAPVLIWMTDEAASRTYFNRPWLEYTGEPAERHQEDGWIDFVHPEDRPRCLRIIERGLEALSPVSLEYRLRRHDGTYRWMLENAVPRYRADASFAGYIGSCIDINEQKATEWSLLEARDHAEEMSKLKSTFLTNITHEIRTPLTVILGFTSILRQGVRPEYQRFVNLIERSGRRLLLMLDSMIDLAQLEAGTLVVDRKSYNVNEVVESAVISIQPLADEKGLDLELSLPEERCQARFDHSVLARVINNLLDNALKFTDEGRIDVIVTKTNAHVRITVQDSGIGIDETFLKHVFDPFVQESTGLDRTHQGSGLGLSVSKRLLELMGGTITVTSEKGGGTIFTLILPSAE